MAKLKKKSLIEGISGKLGKHLVLRQMKDGRVIVASVPDFSERIFSEEQVNHQGRFQQASAYAQRASKENPLYAELAAGRSHSAYNLALSDWFHPPVIHNVTRRSGRIYILASDNVRVACVRVTVLDGQGQIAEQGEAQLIKGERWAYTPSTPAGSLVVAEAIDLAGNVTRYEAEMIVS